MNYSVIEDIQAVCSVLGVSPSGLANKLNVARSTIARILSKQSAPSELFLERFYSFAYENPSHPIRLNELKIQFAKDEHPHLLFHGSKESIKGAIDLNHSRDSLDMGRGFYLGENYAQVSSYIYPHPRSSVYLFDAASFQNLRIYEYQVGLEWMLMVCFFRRRIDSYANSPVLRSFLDHSTNQDVLIAPIADNNMYETMNQFARGDITDLQAISALSASSLGRQFVLKSDLACRKIHMLDRLYLCEQERKDIERRRMEAAKTAQDKAKLAIEKYRRQGRYIEEILG